MPADHRAKDFKYVTVICSMLRVRILMWRVSSATPSRVAKCLSAKPVFTCRVTVAELQLKHAPRSFRTRIPGANRSGNSPELTKIPARSSRLSKSPTKASQAQSAHEACLDPFGCSEPIRTASDLGYFRLLVHKTILGRLTRSGE